MNTVTYNEFIPYMEPESVDIYYIVRPNEIKKATERAKQCVHVNPVEIDSKENQPIPVSDNSVA